MDQIGTICFISRWMLTVDSVSSFLKVIQVDIAVVLRYIIFSCTQYNFWMKQTEWLHSAFDTVTAIWFVRRNLICLVFISSFRAQMLLYACILRVVCLSFQTNFGTVCSVSVGFPTKRYRAAFCAQTSLTKSEGNIIAECAVKSFATSAAKKR